MSRNGSGTYTLPAGNPVVTGTTIETSWANTTLSDIATALTDSLSRSGQGGMTAAFRGADGTSGLPGISFTNETTTGLYRAGSADLRLAITTNQIQQWLATGTSVTGTFAVSGNVTLSGGTANGVAYLDGSKIVTTGTSLVFDGTNLGVGTTAPAFGSGSGVEIQRAGVATLRLENSTASNSFEMYVDSAASGINLRGRDSSPMNFWTANTSQMTLDTSGNLGIGTGAPAAKLEVVGTVGNVQVDGSGARLTFTRNDANYIRYGSTTGELIFEEGTTERFRIGSAGELGIGGTNYGTSGQVLASQGAGSPPVWTNAATGDVTLTGTQTLTNKTLGSGTLFGAAVNGQDNDLSRVDLKDYGYVYFNSGTTNALDFTNGSHQRWAPNTGSQTLSITNWPPTGNLGELLIEGVNLGAATITWPTINWIKSDGTTTTTFASNGVTLQTSGTDWVVLWTRDAGTTIYGKIIR